MRRDANVGHGEGHRHLQRLLPRLDGHLGQSQANECGRRSASRGRVCRGKGILHAAVRQGRPGDRALRLHRDARRALRPAADRHRADAARADAKRSPGAARPFGAAIPTITSAAPQGTATAFAKDVPLCGLAGPRVLPKWSWSLDGNKYGSNDFRSTKMNIFEASLRSADGNGAASALRRFAARAKLGGRRPRAFAGGGLRERRRGRRSSTST